MRFRVNKTNLNHLPTHPLPHNPSPTLHNSFLMTIPRQFLCCSSSLSVCLWFNKWNLFCLYLFLISHSVGASGGLSFVIVAFPGYLHSFCLVVLKFCLDCSHSLYQYQINLDKYPRCTKGSQIGFFVINLQLVGTSDRLYMC